MPFAQLATGATLEEYTKVQDRLAATGTPVPGRILQVCYDDKDNLQILNVWESQEAADAFFQSVMVPLLEEFGLADRDYDIQTCEVHKVSIG
jgi:hypothetical protein